MYLAAAAAAVVVGVKPLENFKLELTFENQEIRVFDVTPYLETGIFKELKDISIFNTVSVSFDTICWSNGLDFDPKSLYKLSTLISDKKGLTT